MSADKDSSDLLKFPSGLESSGDPSEGNPFPVGDPRHKVWDDATHEAEEQWCRLSSESEDVLIDPKCEHFARKFDIWAKRGACVVSSDTDIRAYDRWLISYGEAWLQDVSAKKFYSPDQLAVLRLVLTKRVAWWKAEVRGFISKQKAHREQHAPERSAATEALATAPQRKRAPRSKPPCFEVAVEQLRKDRKLTLLDFCRLMDRKAEQFSTALKYQPPKSWRVRSFFEQYKKRGNTVSRFLTDARKEAEKPRD